MDAAQLVRDLRARAGLSVRGLSEAAGVASSTIHRIEKGDMHPTVALLQQIAEAAGARLQIAARPDYAVSLVGLALQVRDDLQSGESAQSVRRAAELIHRFDRADPATQQRMIGGRPPDTGDMRWNAFIGALAEWLALRAGLSTPTWAREADRYLDGGWWVTPMKSLRAWEYAGSPASFHAHGVYLHRESLVNV